MVVHPRPRALGLYEELSLTRRVRLHQRIGEALERITGGTPDGPHLAELAHHFAQAAVAGHAAKAVDYGRRAARHSATLAAYEEGVRHLTVVLEVAEDAGAPAAERADLLLEIGDLHWSTGAAAAARDAFARAAALVGETDPARGARAVLGHAGAHQRSVWVELALSQDRTINMLREGLDRLSDGDSSLRARLLACLGRELSRVPGSAEEQAGLAAEAIAMARRVGDPATIASALLDACLAMYGPHTVGQRADMAAEAAALAIALEDRLLEGHAALHRFHAEAEAGHLDRALVHLDRATDLLTALRDPSAEYLIPTYHGGLAQLEGRLEDAMALTADGFSRGHERGDPNAIIVFGGSTLGTYLYAGRGGELLDLVFQVHDLYPTLRQSAAAIEAALLAELGLGQECQAVLQLAEPSALPRDPFWTFAAQCLARAYWRIGDAPRAEELGRLMLPYADHFAGIATIGLGPLRVGLALCAATTGRYDEAEAHLDIAAEIADRHGWAAVRAEVLLRRAAVLTARRGPDDEVPARAALAEGFALAEHLNLAGLVRDGVALRALLDGTPAPPAAEPVAVRRRDRARSAITTKGRAAVAWWTRDDSDEDLLRRFGTARAQRTLFGAMSRAFQPTRSHGFLGVIAVELRPPDDGMEAVPPDWWTIDIRATAATVRSGRPDDPALTVHTTLPDFIRLCSGELTLAQAVVGARIVIEGDVILAARIPVMFGALEPAIGSLPPAAASGA